MFQKVILDRDREKGCVYFDGNNSTNSSKKILLLAQEDEMAKQPIVGETLISTYKPPILIGGS